jgi:hypothetical protein
MEKKERITVPIILFEESWEWFFGTIHNNKNAIERADGQSAGNFWTILQVMEQQYRENRKKSKDVKPK